MKPVGILALQGDYEKHRQSFDALGVETFGVRRAGELDRISGLVIPGGESTTLTRLVDRVELRRPLLEFAREMPLMGTCAGLIMLARRLVDERFEDFGVEPLGLLDCDVRRNGYGRQIDSFTAGLDIRALDGSDEPFPAVFIRAPRLTRIGPQVEVIAAVDGEPAAVRQGRILGMTFHPELTDDRRFHQAFLDRVVAV